MKILADMTMRGVMRLLLVCAAFTLSACSFIYDDEEDCSVNYRVRFAYDMNLKFADAFSHEVGDVTLYVFGKDGKFIRQYEEQGEPLRQPGYVMPLDGMEPGEYTLLAWCGLKGGRRSFSVPQMTPGVTTLQEARCTLSARSRESDGATVHTELDDLYHGLQTVTLTDRPGTYTFDMPLMKNTNYVRVVLQQLSGSPVDVNDFLFTITDDNGLMDYDNTLLPDETLTYRPWHTSQGTAGMDDGTGTDTPVSVAVAEMTVARLVKDKQTKTRLTISRKSDGEKVLSIPLTDYALLVKGQYNKNMDDQEYLDRQDEYSMVFFLDKDHNWLNAYIYINSWKVVLGSITLR